MKYLLLILASTILGFSCSSRKKIETLLRSERVDDLIAGSFMAGESKDKAYIPLLLNKCDDPRGSTNINFKGFTVYQEKMIALQKIFGKSPPIAISSNPDSAVIYFYLTLSKNDSP